MAPLELVHALLALRERARAHVRRERRALLVRLGRGERRRAAEALEQVALHRADALALRGRARAQRVVAAAHGLGAAARELGVERVLDVELHAREPLVRRAVALGRGARGGGGRRRGAGRFGIAAAAGFAPRARGASRARRARRGAALVASGRRERAGRRRDRARRRARRADAASASSGEAGAPANARIAIARAPRSMIERARVARARLGFVRARDGGRGLLVLRGKRARVLLVSLR